MTLFGPVRLLPLTTAALACVLTVKSVQIVRAVANTATAQTAAVTQTKAEAPPSPAAAPKPAADTPPPVTDAERAVLLELRHRRQELDARETALVAREFVLAAAEQKISARVAELQSLQKKLEVLDAARQQREDAGWQGLVKVYETMKPRDAAAIFNDLDMSVLLQVVDRMKEAKAAPVMAAMQPDKAREVTKKLADMRTRRNEPGGG